ncbi:MAG: hypothetical protein Q4D96_14155 [Propionibacteriaceae bacterium]|nr:hypothetical protein [Propionibacteriaceae bacterium]
MKEAIARGDVEITYELVRSHPSGKITLSKFHLDTQPTLPNGIINKN